MKIALSGATGLIGSRFFDVLKNKYEIIPISSSFNVDITDKNKIKRFLSSKNPAFIVHLAAKTNVDACEEDRENDMKKLAKAKVYNDGKIDFENLKSEEWKNSKTAFGINVVGTKNLSDYAVDKNIKIIYISTDFVFDGEKEGAYSEEDDVSPINWYGQTKYWGEEALAVGDFLIARIAFPFGYKSNIKADFIRSLIEVIKKQDRIRLVSDQVITPTFIEDIVNGIDFLIEKNISGIINLVGNNFFSPYEIGVTLAREFSLDESKIELTTRAEVYRGRAARPFKVMLENDKLKDLGFAMTDFFEALKQIKLHST